MYQLHLGAHGLLVPGLHRGHAHALAGGDGAAGGLHHVGVQTVAGEGGNAVFRAGLDQHVVIGQVVVLIGVVHGHRPHGAGEEGVAEALSEQLQGGVRIAALMDGVHVHPDALPGVEIPDGVVAYALGAGAGNVVGAGTAVAPGAGLAVGAHGLPGVGKNFGVSHICFLLRIFLLS